MIYTGKPEPTNVGQFITDEATSTGGTYERVESEYSDQSSRFLVKDRNFSRQYAHLYAERLWTARPKLIKAAKAKWDADIPVCKLHELQSDTRCIMVGTIFKHMELKPNILKEISEEHNLMPQPIRTRYTDASDKLILEDELQRIILVGQPSCSRIVTGVIVAVLGHEPEEDRGKFVVEDYCFQLLPEPLPRPAFSQDRYVLLVSGLELGGPEERPFSLQLLVDLLTGQVGDGDQQRATSQIARVIVAGNSLSRSTQDRDSLSKAKYLTKKSSAGSVEAMKNLDDIMYQLSGSVEVALMAGEFDPSNHVLPQQPLHRCMFPRSARNTTFTGVTNPHQCSLDGVRILGTSGQPVDDVRRYSELDDPLDILEKTLEWGHIAPTAPDTLNCYPFYGADPFLLEECPHIYFVGNQPDFKHKLVKSAEGREVLLVTVPRFCQTATAVLVNLTTLDCTPLSFRAQLPTATAAAGGGSPEVDK
ncbi:hypothetical protein ACOMHN_046657 [Nucella lapillus]